MKKLIIVVLMMLTVQIVFAQKKKDDAVKPEKSDTVKLPLSKFNIETLVDLNRKSGKIREQIAPLQNQLNLIDSTWNSVLKTKLDAHGYDPDAGRWGIMGMNLVYIPNDTSKIVSAGSATTVPKNK